MMRRGQLGQIVTRLSLTQPTKLRPSLDARSEVSMPPPSAVQKQENTYQLTPVDETRFNCARTHDVLSSCLHDVIGDTQYSNEVARHLTRELSATVLQRVKGLGFQRYKLVAEVQLGEAAGQGLRVGSRCIWDASTDTMSSASFDNKSIVASVTVYAVYFD